VGGTHDSVPVGTSNIRKPKVIGSNISSRCEKSELHHSNKERKQMIGNDQEHGDGEEGR